MNRRCFYDYCHYEYFPDRNVRNAMKSIELLFDSFKFANCNKSFFDLVDCIRRKLGPEQTVWGVKKSDELISWEFYFYNWEKKNPQITISNLLKICRPFFTSRIVPDENISYFMFSIDISSDLLASRKLPGVHVYAGDSYFLDETGMTLENQYNFYSPKKDIRKLVCDIKQSTIVDFSRIKLTSILWPELIDCYSICRSRKKKKDAIYYSRLNLQQFLFFLKKLNYPKEIIAFIERNRAKLGHLKFDIGFDYVMHGSTIEIVKSGYYGTF